MYRCEVCNVPAVLLDGAIIRPCEHQDAPVIADMTARVYGEGGCSDQPEDKPDGGV